MSSAYATVVNPPIRMLPSLLALIRDAEREDRHEVLESHRWINHANADAENLHGIGVVRGDTMIGYAHLRRHHRHGVELDLVIAPTARWDARAIVAALVDAACDSTTIDPGEELFAWVPASSAEVVKALRSLGFQADRSILQLRRPLPLPKDHPARPLQAPPVSVRPFVPGVDEEAWLEVNNRAFAGHPDQGDWDRATLVSREREPWFDPEGFLMAWQGDELVGFCWTKVHTPRAGEPLGEIYVIASDPTRAPRGLGSWLLTLGLDLLASRGLPTAMLYVERSNDRARSLYDRFGFALDHEDLRLVRRWQPRD